LNNLKVQAAAGCVEKKYSRRRRSGENFENFPAIVLPT
jgi:hypothetical protein